MEPRPSSKHAGFYQDFLDLARTLILAVILYAIITTLVGRYEILNISMEPTFHEGQRVIVNRAERLLPPWLTHVAHANADQADTSAILKHGQVAIFFPTDAHVGDPLIKRVIALPGDHLTIHDGQVWVNG
jgi:signal peptidase I